MYSSAEIRAKLIFGLGQIRSEIADFHSNRQRILDVCHRASAEGAKFLILPGFALGGCPALDLWFRDEFLEKEGETLTFLQESLPRDFVLIFGSFWRHNPADYRENPRHISILALSSDGIEHAHHKTVLAKEALFFEERYFAPSREELRPYIRHGLRIGMLNYDECLYPHGENTPLAALKAENLDILIIVDSAPYEQDLENARMSVLRNISIGSFPIIYVNAVGGQQGIVFDGQSRMIKPDGQIVKCAAFTDEVLYVKPFAREVIEQEPPISDEEMLRGALVCGIKDFVESNGFSRVHLGLSGGVDSALVATLAVMALGKENVTGILMPSCFSSVGSVEDANALAKNLGINTLLISIDKMHLLAREILGEHFLVEGLVDENLQARLRGVYLMSYSNANKSLLLTTGNKSELAVGYSTLYGDSCGVLSVIGDLWKLQVYELCRYINEQAGHGLIPEEIVKKEPSAELRPDQKDRDSLPEYAVLDGILSRYVEHRYSIKDLVRAGYSQDVVESLLMLFHASQYKRNQYAPIIRTSRTTFGLGSMWPLIKK